MAKEGTTNLVTFRDTNFNEFVDSESHKMNWIFWLCILGFFKCQVGDAQAQRVAPGVPPQHYQQPQAHHVPHQQQVHHQQQQQQPPPPQQYQQAPPQQQQVPVQNVPVQQHGHAHSHDVPPQQILNAANMAQEKAHIQEHMDVPIDTSKMSEQELQFHYFKMHDADNNNKLDGCELIKSLIHWHEQGHKDPNQPTASEGKLFKDDELINLIDPILNMDDTNKDGYIDYPEFIQAQQKAAAGTRQ